MSGRGDDAYWRKAKEKHELLTGPVWLRPGGQHEPDLRDIPDKFTMKDGTTVIVSKEGAGSMPKQRGAVLKEAINTINGERQDVYGSPEDSFALIAKYWQTYLESRPGLMTFMGAKPDHADPLCGEDVAIMMTLFKIAREANQHKRDNIIDAAGYLGIYADMQGEE